MQEALYFEEVAGVPPYALMLNAVAYPIAHEEGMIPDMDDGCGGIALHQLLRLRRLRLNDNDLSGACERHVSQCRLRIYTYVQCCQQGCGGDKQCYIYLQRGQGHTVDLASCHLPHPKRLPSIFVVFELTGQGCLVSLVGAELRAGDDEFFSS